MKNILLKMVIVPATVSLCANAQKDSSGIYLNANDFNQKKLSYAINCKIEKHKIKRYAFFAKDYITVIHQGIKYQLSKDSVFGFRTCDEKSFRIIDKTDYSILNPDDDLLLYKFQVMSTAKDPRSPIFKFSVRANGALFDLNTTNLKNIFPDNHAFHDELDSQFRNKNSLLEFDNYHKQYKLVRLFNKYK
ncbi:MAG: hypothetical protein V4717_14700 [Bacteroidota bacterium]